jgi:branched-subunit amino acid aminotransferase/4-amino-4-deoxychorismate lyase
MEPVAPPFAPWLGVFETLRVVEGTPLFVAEHLAELRRAMETLGLSTAFDPSAARNELPRASGRWRWVVTSAEARTLFSPEEPVMPVLIEMALSPVRVGSANWDARFKTVSYLSHAQAATTARTPERRARESFLAAAGAAFHAGARGWVPARGRARLCFGAGEGRAGPFPGG